MVCGVVQYNPADIQGACAKGLSEYYLVCIDDMASTLSVAQGIPIRRTFRALKILVRFSHFVIINEWTNKPKSIG